MTQMHTMTAPQQQHRSLDLNYHHGESRTVFTTDIETLFPDGCLITSRTNLEGIITHANHAFVELSGWERDEIIGQPHSILRHPDMPKAAFADLWETVSKGNKWSGYVKNLRKDGGYYWVYATVIPNIRQGQIVGYTSVRRKPAQHKILEIEKTYAAMLATE